MTILDTARKFHLRFVQGSYPLSAGTYGGTGTYGDADLTYGSEPGESVLAGALYKLAPYPGDRSHTPSWLYREGDTAKGFKANIVERDNQSIKLDLSTVATAVLWLTPIGLTNNGLTATSFALTVDVSNNFVERTWTDGDLSKGRFIASVILTFNSGRVMTVETDDEIQIEVIESGLELGS